MKRTASEKSLAKAISFGSAFTTIFVLSGAVTDPVNVTKLLSLGFFASIILGLYCSEGKSIFKPANKLLALSVVSFLGSGLVSLVFSHSPLTQGLYGSYGRNNGWLTYCFLVILLITAASLTLPASFQSVIKGLLVAGVINVLYCGWVLIFGDFIGWNNPYGQILGTFGNPNFIGAFLGIFISAYFAYSLAPESPKWFKLSTILVVPIAAFEIFQSNAIQGRVVAATGAGIVIFFYIKAKLNKFYLVAYALTATVATTLALLGALQIGPLVSLIYKTSVSLRGQYWLAGWNTGMEHPLTGVGMDAFGDWYRRARDQHALELPGVNTIVNAAHNVPMDMFAFGGWPLLVSYLAIMFLGAAALVKCVLRTKHYDSTLVILSASWFGYQLQSIISINQIGLAVWGWVLTGAAIAYERATRTDLNINPSNLRRVENNSMNLDPKSLIFSTGFGLVGLLLVLPPFVADSNWRSAQVSQTLLPIENSLKISYFNPANTQKYLLNIQNLEGSKLFDLSHRYALEGVRWNPESFELWKVLYLVQNSTQQDRELALANMKRLDPLNPDVSATQ